MKDGRRPLAPKTPRGTTEDCKALVSKYFWFLTRERRGWFLSTVGCPYVYDTER